MKKTQFLTTAICLVIALSGAASLVAQNPFSQNAANVWLTNLNQNLFIGSTLSNAKLSVVGSNAPTAEFRNTTTDFARLRLANSNNGYWDIAGVMGNTDADDRLNFFHNAVGNILSITGSGNVGIGTTSPVAKLQVNGAAYINTDVIVRKFLYVGDDATNNGTYDIRFGSNNQGTGEGIGSKRTAGGNQYGLDFFTSGFSRLSIFNNGNVGINKQLFVGSSSNNGSIDIGFGANNSGEGIGCKRTAGGNQYGLDFYTSYGTNRMSITNAGKVGIGISDPAKMPGNYKLYVADGILTEKVKVALKNTNDWADYVFDDQYDLRPLNVVEAYIREKKHLPGMPSAEDLQETGIDLAMMDAKLLEKIEELTLYVIDIKKENEFLRQEIKAIKKGKSR